VSNRPNDYWLHSWEVYSRTDPSKKWKVSLSRTGVWGCACPKWRFAHAPKPDCHHILKIKKVEPAAPAPLAARKTVTLPTLGVQITAPAATSTPYFVTQTTRVVCMEDDL